MGNRIVIKAPDGESYLNGEVSPSQEPPEKILSEIQTDNNPYFDYFIFQDKDQSYIFKTDASNFSATTLPKDTPVWLEGVPKAKIYRIYDNENGYPKITNVKIELDRAGHPKPYEGKLQQTIDDLIIPQLKEKSPSYSEIVATIEKALGIEKNLITDLSKAFQAYEAARGEGKEKDKERKGFEK